MAYKTNCIKNGIPYYRITKTVGKKQNKKGVWVDNKKEFYGKNKKEAEAKFLEYQKQKQAGISTDQQYFGIIADFYVYSVFINDSKYSMGTKERYDQVYRKYIKPSFLGGQLIQSITSSMIQNFYNELNCSSSTLRAINNIMGHLFKYLEKEGYCRNLIRSVVLPKKESRSRKEDQEIEVWENYELKAIHQGLKDNRIRLIVMLLTFTGCRISEILGLKYSDIRDNKVYINRALVFDVTITTNGKSKKRLVIGPTKTPNAIRSIPIPANVIEEIEIHREKHNKEMIANGYNTDYIFTTKTGNFIERHNLDTAFKRYYKSIGIAPRRFHVYRHTFCSMLCKNGVPLHTAYKLMGHSNIQQTAKFYINIDDEQKEDAIKKLLVGMEILNDDK